MEKKPCCMRTWPAPPQVEQLTGSRALLRAAAVAGIAADLGRHIDCYGVATDGFLQIEVQLIAKIGAAKYLRPATPATTAAKNVAEHIAENVAEAFGAEAAGRPPAHAQPS